MNIQKRIYNQSKGVESLTKEEHGRFFEAVQRLSLSNDVKQAAVALYLDFKARPVGEYNADRKNLDIFLIASVSLAAKALGELRTDQEFQSRLFVDSKKLLDAEERLIRSFSIQDSVIPYSELVRQLTTRQIEGMADGFVERELIAEKERDELVQLSQEYLDSALENGLNAKMSYRGRAAAVMLKAVRDLELQVSDTDIARAAGFDKKTMMINANTIDTLLNDSKHVQKGETACKTPQFRLTNG